MAEELTLDAVAQAAKEAKAERDQQKEADPSKATPPEDTPESGDDRIPPEEDEKESAKADEDKAEDEVDDESDDEIPPEEGVTDPDLIALAEDLGLAEMVSLFESDEKLAKALLVMQRQRPPEDKADGKDAPKEDDAAPLNLDLSEDDYDPALVKAIKDMNAYYAERDKATRQELAELKKSLEAKAQADEADEQAQIVERFDDAIEKLGKDYEDVLGKGPRDQVMRTNRNAYETRMDILEQMDAIAEVRSRSGRKPLSFDTLFSRSVNAVLSGQKRRIAERDKSDKRSKRDEQTVERAPDRKVQSTVPAKEKAIERVKSIMREKGISTD